MTCSKILQAEGKEYPRTCADHGLSCPPAAIVLESGVYSHRIELRENPVTEFRGRYGVWVIYGYGNELEVHYITNSPIDAIMEMTKSYSWLKIGFWPNGTYLNDAVKWWEAEANRDLQSEWSKMYGRNDEHTT